MAWVRYVAHKLTSSLKRQLEDMIASLLGSVHAKALGIFPDFERQSS